MSDDCSWPGCTFEPSETVADPPGEEPRVLDDGETADPGVVTGGFCPTHADRVLEDHEWGVDELPEFVDSDVEWISGSSTEVADD
ncbi:hypothetical protein [Halobaculum sp. EA56]|uniref:hypothetical protein n=1 Tax=Halobaculum sp. EA56 TaxID=3421648 RepID=UPI003EBE9EDD